MMEIRTDTLLSTVDRVSRRLGPVSSLIAFLADRVAPATTARADTCPPPDASICFKSCDYTDHCCSQAPPGTRLERFIHYKQPGYDCSQANKCSLGCNDSDCALCP
jgi:hypothetical protein